MFSWLSTVPCHTQEVSLLWSTGRVFYNMTGTGGKVPGIVLTRKQKRPGGKKWIPHHLTLNDTDQMGGNVNWTGRSRTSE